MGFVQLARALQWRLDMRETKQWAVGFLAAALLLAACSDADSEAPGGGDAGLAGMSSTGGAKDDEPSDCSSVEDDQPEAATIRVVNDTASTLHLGEETKNCADSLGWRFELRDVEGQRLSEVGACRTCRDATVTGVGGCPSACFTQPALTLKPGEHVDLPWDGLYGVDVALPEACLLPDSGAVATAECRRATRVAAGAHTFTVRAGATLDCGETCGPCRAQEGGGCVTQGALVESLEVEASAEVELGTGDGLQGPIELVFRD